MIEPRKRVRQVLHNVLPLKYRIKESNGGSGEFVQRKLFIEIIERLKEIEDRKDLLQTKVGIDMTQYEDPFFHIIENLLRLHFNEHQIGLIQMWVFDLTRDPEWDGTVTLKGENIEKKFNFRTPSDVWKVINNL